MICDDDQNIRPSFLFFLIVIVFHLFFLPYLHLRAHPVLRFHSILCQTEVFALCLLSNQPPINFLFDDDDDDDDDHDDDDDDDHDHDDDHDDDDDDGSF